MRKITMVSTKDHFLYLVSCDYTGEEVWSEPTGQMIGFLPTGSIDTFTGTEGNWSAWTLNNTITSPALMSRTDGVAFGCVASNDNSVSITIAPKELSVSGTWNEFTPLLANTGELSVISQDTNTAFVINEQCFATSYRDLDTFNITSANTFISNSEITII